MEARVPWLSHSDAQVNWPEGDEEEEQEMKCEKNEVGECERVCMYLDPREAEFFYRVIGGDDTSKVRKIFHCGRGGSHHPCLVR